MKRGGEGNLADKALQTWMNAMTLLMSIHLNGLAGINKERQNVSTEQSNTCTCWDKIFTRLILSDFYILYQ